MFANRMRVLGSAAAGALALVLLAGTAKADTTRIFGNWTTSCWTSEQRCAAENDGYGPPPRRTRQMTMSFSRRDGADADWDLSLRLHGAHPAKGAAMAFQVDASDEIRFAQGKGYTLAPGGTTARLEDSDQLTRLGRALPDGKTLTISYAGRDGASITTDISLIGLTAALDWISGRQGRAATEAPFAAAKEPPAPPQIAARPKPAPDMAARPMAESPPAPAPQTQKQQEKKPQGAGAAQAEAAAPAKPAEAKPAEAKPAGPKSVQAEPAQPAQPAQPVQGRPELPGTLLKRHFTASECDPLTEGALSADAAIQADLGDGKTLYIIPCFAGAYNTAYRVYLVRNGENEKARTLYFANFSQSLGWYGSDTLINASYEPDTKALISFGKGRGLGDCGNAARYTWDGFDFRMIEYRAWDQCDGSRQPEQWPVIYKAE